MPTLRLLHQCKLEFGNTSMHLCFSLVMHVSILGQMFSTAVWWSGPFSIQVVSVFIFFPTFSPFLPFIFRGLGGNGRFDVCSL